MTEKFSSSFGSTSHKFSTYPQEALDKIAKRKGRLTIGIPKETTPYENRVSIKPESVEVLTGHNIEVIIESEAGALSNFSDIEYSNAGGIIVYSHNEAFEADCVIKVQPPTLEEIEMMTMGAGMISAVQTGNVTVGYIEALNKKKITSIAYEYLEDPEGGLPIVRAMSEIAGINVMQIAGEYLTATNNGMGIIIGGITGVPPSKVVILGAGTVAEYASRAAIGLGADVQVFDNEIYKLRRLKHSLNQQVFTSTYDSVTITEALKAADVLIGAVRIEKGRPKVIVTEEMISDMKPGSIVIDVSIDQGGCIETSKETNLKNPTYKKSGVVHYCVPNIASRVPRTASYALSNILTPILISAQDVGGIEDMMFGQKWFMKGVYTYKGSLTNVHLARKFNMKYKDLNLIMAARF